MGGRDVQRILVYETPIPRPFANAPTNTASGSLASQNSREFFGHFPPHWRSSRGKWSLDGVHLWNERGSGEPIQRRREGYDTASRTLDVWCSGICHPMSWLAVTFTTQEINSLIRWLAMRYQPTSGPSRANQGVKILSAATVPLGGCVWVGVPHLGVGAPRHPPSLRSETL